MIDKGDHDLPHGWRIRVRELSAGVYEGTASDLHGHVVVGAGIDVNDVIEDVTSSARAMQSEMDGAADAGV